MITRSEEKLIGLVLYNANVITMDRSRPGAQLVSVRGDSVHLLGDNGLLSGLGGEGVRTIDCRGKTVLPGFHDAHCHILAFARSLLSLDCSPAAVKSVMDIKSGIAGRARSAPPGSWITCNGYNEFHLAEKRHPTRADLDEAAPCHPVKLAHFSGHVCVLNTAALRAVGITSVTPEPPGGLIERHAETGEPNGILFEMNHLVDRAIPAPSGAELDKAIGSANEHYLSLGITSLQDATQDNGFGRWQMFKRLKAQGALSPRITMMTGLEQLERSNKAGLFPGSGDSQLRIGAVKIMVTESTGRLSPSQQELNERVLDVHQAGGQVAIHAIEETTIDAALTALENALSRNPRTGHRHRIEHCSECSPALLTRVRKAGAVVVSQPPFVFYGGDRYMVQVPERQRPFLYRFGSMIRAGVATAAGSDSPVVPANPFIGLYAAITRLTSGRQKLLAEEAVSVFDALAMYTTNAAYSCFQEQSIGSIKAGRPADLIVVDADPIVVQPESIKNIKVDKTIIGGSVVWDRMSAAGHNRTDTGEGHALTYQKKRN